MPLLTGRQITARRVAGEDHTNLVAVSVADAAKLSEVSIDTIRRRLRAGELELTHSPAHVFLSDGS